MHVKKMVKRHMENWLQCINENHFSYSYLFRKSLKFKSTFLKMELAKIQRIIQYIAQTFPVIINH